MIWFVPLLIIAGVAAVGVTIYVITINNKTSTSPTSKTRKIILLGLKGCGKTTMWKLLKGESPRKGEYAPTVTPNEVASFHIAKGGYNVTINASTDIGGGDLFVGQYNALIDSETFVYYLIDLTKINDDKVCVDINIQLYKIVSIFKEKGIEEKVGIKIIATHLDETNPKLSKDEAIETVANAIKLKYHDNRIFALDLFDEQEFNILKEEIFDAYTR